jgi:predicted AlkP superfamily phosphohydrolase/phosphomutase
VGGAGLFVRENDTGPDDANHAQHGILIFHDPTRPAAQRHLDGLSIYDVLPSLLARYTLPVPGDLRGTVREW